MPERVVDLGCGGGRNIGALLKRYPSAKGTAVDYSDLSVEKAKGVNAGVIAQGRLEVKQGDGSSPEQTLDNCDREEMT